MDIPNGNTNIGTQIAVNYNNNDNAQKWWTNNSQEIRSKLNTDRCLDISGGNYTNGTTIALHYCTGNDAQKFFFYGNTLRSWANPNYCIDVPSNNWTPNVVQLWDCNSSGAQKFVPGDNGFNNTFQVQIATNGGILAGNGLSSGHTFVIFKTNNQLNNTMSLWPDYDTNCDNGRPGWASTRDFLRQNNMCDFDGVKVDWEKTQTEGDLYYALNTANTGFTVKTTSIKKTTSDLYRFGGGYRIGDNWGRDNVNYDYNAFWWGANRNNGNCVSFSQYLWNDMMSTDGKLFMRIKPDAVISAPATLLNYY